ncbi:hypothetical protein QTO30_18300 [Yoonia sp. GPGPB17]|uniref:hypothetical protein n=1 Tax=Yoonia sp. GPGPB17 TaxID=3026147 RepID=UPI0030C3874F
MTDAIQSSTVGGMTAEPEFKTHAKLSLALDAACGPARVPEGKGGHVFVDGTLHRILDIKQTLTGDAAFGYSVNEKELTHLCTCVDVKALSFKGLRTTTLEPLRQMPRLNLLNLWWVQKLADLSPLAGMHLRYLVLDDIRYANDIEPVGKVIGLETLTLVSGMNSTQLIDTLEPLCALPNLRELSLMSLKLGDDSLRPLVGCMALHDLSLPNTFPTEEYAYLRAKRPDIRCASLAPYQRAGYVADGKDVMVTGLAQAVSEFNKRRQTAGQIY